MKFKHILSLLLFASFFSAFVISKPALRTEKRYFIDTEKGLIKMSIMYPYAKGKTFDMDYYEKKHMPMVAGFLGSNLVKYTIEKGIPDGNQPLLYMAVGTFYVRSMSEYKKAIVPNLEAIGKDIPKYTNINPVFLTSEVVK